MWTAGRSSACKLQQGLNSQDLAKRQGGHGWLGPQARAPTAQEPSWGFLPRPPQLSPCLDDRQALLLLLNHGNKQAGPGRNK